MKILMVNKFYYIKGGSETYYFALKRLLESKGHTVIDFSMKDINNFDSPYSSYFVRNIDYNSGYSKLSKIKDGLNIIYSREAKKKFEEIIKDTKPDLIHLHIFQHQLSPSILGVIRKYNIPAIYTAHDLKMVCPNYKMMHHGIICEECENGKFYHCAKNRCVKDSFVKSCINVVEGYFHKWIHSYDVLGAIITPSSFYKKKFEKFGVAKNRIMYIPNFLDTPVPRVENLKNKERYYLYFGRLSEEKGLLTLIRSFAINNLQLHIVGTGPMKEQLESYIIKYNIKNVNVLGFKSGTELTNIIGNARAVILPSEWYENGPYSAIEALQIGRPIIGANIGGIPEMIKNNGFLFESGNIDELNKAILKMDNVSDNEYKHMEQASFELYLNTYTKDEHYKLLKKVYENFGLVI